MQGPTPARILVIDDSPGVLRIAETVLHEAGFSVTCATRGGEALEVAHDLRPQLVLVSYALADGGGYDLCAKQKKVSEIICGDVYGEIGKHGDNTMHLLDIWPTFAGAANDTRLQAVKKKLKNRLWAWGNV